MRRSHNGKGKRLASLLGIDYVRVMVVLHPVVWCQVVPASVNDEPGATDEWYSTD